MSFFKRLFGKGNKTETPAKPKLETDNRENKTGTPVKTNLEADNRGTRHTKEDDTVAYWTKRRMSSTFDPFVLYSFATPEAAKEALLELPCIHVAQDSGNLICTERLIFGYYATEDGKYDAIICGANLTHKLWKIAKDSFIKHGGVPRGQGDSEPE